jgi:hypothetical protein
MNDRTPYFDYNGKHVAAIGKNGSSAIARAIHFSLKPDYEVVSASGNQTMVDKVMHNPGWQALAPKTFEPIAPAIPVRDPVERFRSACAQEGKTADEAIAKIEAGEVSFHFKPASSYLKTDSTLYKFPEQLPELATWLGLAEIPEVNTSETNNGPKPDLTPAQLTRMQEIYADDIALYASISEAGQVWIKPPTPVTEEARAAKIAELERDRYNAEVAGITLPDGKEVRTDKETQSELGKALGIIGTINPALEIDWKFPSGEVVHMDAAQIQQIAGAVFAHVHATRTTFKDKAALVAAATTKEELDAINW